MKPVMPGLVMLSLLVGSAFAEPQPLSKADHEAVFKAAGFVPKGDKYVRCDDTVTESFQAGSIETADLNSDGEPEAWVTEGSLFCYGNTAEAFVLVARDNKGEWIKLLDEVGVPTALTTFRNGWPDIKVGGPGPGPFPVYYYDGSKYILSE